MITTNYTAQWLTIQHFRSCTILATDGVLDGINGGTLAESIVGYGHDFEVD